MIRKTAYVVPLAVLAAALVVAFAMPAHAADDTTTTSTSTTLPFTWDYIRKHPPVASGNAVTPIVSPTPTSGNDLPMTGTPIGWKIALAVSLLIFGWSIVWWARGPGVPARSTPEYWQREAAELRAQGDEDRARWADRLAAHSAEWAEIEAHAVRETVKPILDRAFGDGHDDHRG